MKIAIVTDSTCYLPQTEIDQHHITVVPIPVILDGEVYDEGKDITTQEFYAKLKTAKTLKGAVDEVHGAKVYVYDSQITVILMGWLVLAAAQMAEAGKDPQAILARLDDLRATMGEYFIVNDLQNLVRGGRLSNASAFIGGMLKIKPFLTFDDQSHKIVAIEKIRSIKKAYARVETLFQETLAKVDYPVRAVVIHANDPEEAQRWMADLEQKFPNVPFELSYFGPVVGTHLGEKAIALAWMKDFTKA